MNQSPGTVVRGRGTAVVSPYPGMQASELMTLKRAAQTYYQVIPSGFAITISEWGTRIVEETRNRAKGRFYFTYSQRTAAEKAGGDLLSLFLKYGDQS